MPSLAVFFFLSFFISWTIWLPLYGNFFGISFAATFKYNHELGALGPMFAAILTTACFGGKEALKKYLKFFLSRANVSWLTLAFFSPFLIYFLAATCVFFQTTGVSFLPVNLSELEFKPKDFLVFFFITLSFSDLGRSWVGVVLRCHAYKKTLML